MRPWRMEQLSVVSCHPHVDDGMFAPASRGSSVFTGQESSLTQNRPTIREWLPAVTSCSDFGILKAWQPEMALLPPGVSASLNAKAPLQAGFSTVLSPWVWGTCSVLNYADRGPKNPWERSFLGSTSDSDQPSSSCVTSGKACNFSESHW